MRGGLRSDQRSFLDTGFIIIAGCLGSHLGGCRVIGLGLAAMMISAIRATD
jgi:hypothetical protein